MIILLIFAFISGLVTIAAPCIWPLLPIVLSSSIGAKGRPLGVTAGIITSFGILTLTISYLVSLFHFDPDILRLFAVLILVFFGLGMLIPKLSTYMEGLVSKFLGKIQLHGDKRANGFWGGYITGLSLGVVWAPCAGPILATIATLASTQQVTSALFLVTAVYLVGVAIPLFLFATLGNHVFGKSKALSPYLGTIQKIFGIIMIITAVLIYTNFDKVIQVRLLDIFPSYSNFLIQLESNSGVKDQLNKLKGKDTDVSVNQGLFNQIENMDKNSTLPKLATAPEFKGISKWLNSEKDLTLADLKGKVVLIDFWTYTCINCIRTLPHVTGWYEKYKDKGLVVVGVHTPEFEFEKKTENVQNAIKQYQIHYPVAQDNEYRTWDAYNNHYWPAKYLVDANGYIRKYHFGEGEYEQMEEAIRILLTEAGYSLDAVGALMPDETPRIQLTPETYLGANRMERFASNEQITKGLAGYTAPASIPVHAFAYDGQWDVQDEYAASSQGASLNLHFFADKVFLVITPKNPQDKISITLDGQKIGQDQSGKDVKDGQVILDVSRLYELVDLKGKSGEHLLRLEFDSSGIQLYAFTFG